MTGDRRILNRHFLSRTIVNGSLNTFPCATFLLERETRKAWIDLGGPTIPLLLVAERVKTTEAELANELPHILVLDFEGLCWSGIQAVKAGRYTSKLGGFPLENASAEQLIAWLAEILGHENPDYCHDCANHLIDCRCLL